MPRKTASKTNNVEEKVAKEIENKETKKAVSKKEPAKKVTSKSVVKKAKSAEDSSVKTTKKKATSKKSEKDTAVTEVIEKKVEAKSSTKKVVPEIVDDKPVSKKSRTKKDDSTSTKTTATKKASKAVESKTTKKASKEAEPKATKKSSSSKTKTTEKKATKTSKKTISKTATKSTTKKASTKTSTTKSTVKKSTSRANKITATSNLTKKIEILEYYDLPYRYNQTIVKVLAQTPTTLFVYWDISDADRSHYVETYGDNFFNDTKPVLVVHNITMNYSYEIDIDDFANSWYLHVNDSNCEYSVELGRRPKYNNEEFNIPNGYLYVTSSNIMDSPNDHILFDKDLKTVYFRDVKTNIITAKDITSISFLRNMGRIYSLYDLQGHFNEDVFINSNAWRFDFRNPSSSSTFK